MDYKERFMKSLPKTFQAEIKPMVQMKAETNVAHLYLYGDVMDDSYAFSEDQEYISAKKVREQLDKLNGQALTVHLNTFGGMTFEGVAIYNLLMDYKGKVDIQIDGVAASAGSIIAMAGDTITGRPNTMLMVHKGWTMAMGNSNELRQVADMLDKIDESVDATYMTRFKGSREELDELISAETWLTAEESLAKGFYSSIIDDVEEPEQAEPVDEEVSEVREQEEERPKTLFELWNENKNDQETNLFAKFKGAK